MEGLSRPFTDGIGIQIAMRLVNLSSWEQETLADALSPEGSDTPSLVGDLQDESYGAHLLDISWLAQKDALVDFVDYHPFYKRSSVYDGKIMTLPLDGSTDSLERANISTPETLEELITAARLLNGTDNSYGEPQYGFCFNDGGPDCALTGFDLVAVFTQMPGSLQVRNSLAAWQPASAKQPGSLAACKCKTAWQPGSLQVQNSLAAWQPASAKQPGSLAACKCETAWQPGSLQVRNSLAAWQPASAKAEPGSLQVQRLQLQPASAKQPGSLAACKFKPKEPSKACTLIQRFVQTKGAKQGLYIDPVTRQQMLTSVAMREAVRVLHTLRQFSAPPSDEFGCTTHSKAFALARCAMTIGPTRQWKINSYGGDEVDVMTTRLGPPTNFSRVIGGVGVTTIPGSTVVLDRTEGRLVDCTPELCPFERDQVITKTFTQLVNLAPFPGPGGTACSVTKNGDNAIAAYTVYSLCSFAVEPNNSLATIQNPEVESGPFRTSHFSDDALQSFVRVGYNGQETSEFLKTMRYSLEHTNGVQYFRTPGATLLLLGLREATNMVIRGDPSISYSRLETRVISQIATSVGPFESGATAERLVDEYLNDIGFVPARPPVPRASPPPVAQADMVARADKEGQADIEDHTGHLLGGIIGSIAGVLIVSAALWEWRCLYMKKRKKVTIPGIGPSTTILCIRQQLMLYSGYESATEGDSFILSFHNPGDALDFSISTQMALLEAPWPPALLGSSFCGEVLAFTPDSQARFSLGKQSKSGAPEDFGFSQAHFLPAMRSMSSQLGDCGPVVNPAGHGLGANAAGRWASGNGLEGSTTGLFASGHGLGGSTAGLFASGMGLGASAAGLISSGLNSSGLGRLRFDGFTLTLSPNGLVLRSTDSSTTLTKAFNLVPRAQTKDMLAPKTTTLQSVLSQIYALGVAKGIPLPRHVTGLRVRMGFHCGVTQTTEFALNPVTNRIAYSGAPMAMAKDVSDAAAFEQLQELDHPSQLKSPPIVWSLGQFTVKEGMPPIKIYQAFNLHLMARIVGMPPLRVCEICRPGALSAPIGNLAVVKVNMVGFKSMSAWDAEEAAVALSVFEDYSHKLARRFGGFLAYSLPGGTMAAFLSPCAAANWALNLMDVMMSQDLLTHETCEVLIANNMCTIETRLHASSNDNVINRDQLSVPIQRYLPLYTRAVATVRAPSVYRLDSTDEKIHSWSSPSLADRATDSSDAEYTENEYLSHMSADSTPEECFAYADKGTDFMSTLVPIGELEPQTSQNDTSDEALPRAASSSSAVSSCPQIKGMQLSTLPSTRIKSRANGAHSLPLQRIFPAKSLPGHCQVMPGHSSAIVEVHPNPRRANGPRRSISVLERRGLKSQLSFGRLSRSTTGNELDIPLPTSPQKAQVGSSPRGNLLRAEGDHRPPFEIHLRPPSEIQLKPPSEIHLMPPSEIQLKPPSEIHPAHDSFEHVRSLAEMDMPDQYACQQGPSFSSTRKSLSFSGSFRHRLAHNHKYDPLLTTHGSEPGPRQQESASDGSQVKFSIGSLLSQELLSKAFLSKTRPKSKKQLFKALGEELSNAGRNNSVPTTESGKDILVAR
eukprot:gene15515-21604_t